MSLTNKANQLDSVIDNILKSLDSSKESDRDILYAKRYYKELYPLAEAYKKAIKVDRDRTIALQIVHEITGVVDYIGALVAKGDLDLVPLDYLDKFSDLSTIFKESQFRNEKL